MELILIQIINQILCFLCFIVMYFYNQLNSILIGFMIINYFRVRNFSFFFINDESLIRQFIFHLNLLINFNKNIYFYN